MPRSLDRGLTPGSKCVLLKPKEYSARLMGCRIATTREYYRSIYSTVARLATRCSSTVEKYDDLTFGVTVELNCASMVHLCNIKYADNSFCGQDATYPTHLQIRVIRVNDQARQFKLATRRNRA